MCAGTVATPQILMLSGIGPANTLKDAGLPMVVDAQGVGANLQDHPATLTAARAKPEYKDISVTNEVYSFGNTISLVAIAKWLLLGNGPLATTGCDHGAFVDTSGKGGPANLQVGSLGSVLG